MPGKLTIAEAARLIGKNESTIYRYIRKGKLQAEKIPGTDRQVTIIEKAELERVFNISYQADTRQIPGVNSQMPGTAKQLPGIEKQDIKDLLKEVITEQQSQLMKPLEEQAMYIAGTLTKENEFLRQQVETLRNELEAVKALPVEDMTPIKEENEKLKKQLSILPAEPLEVNKILMQNADNLKALQEKLSILPAEPEKVNEILKLGVEKFKAMEDNFIKQAGEKEHLESELKKLQEEAEAMRQKLSRSWWRFWK